MKKTKNRWLASLFTVTQLINAKVDASSIKHQILSFVLNTYMYIKIYIYIYINGYFQST
jgi:hypothetical protein